MAADNDVWAEPTVVRVRRYEEAQKAGLTTAEAHLFADSQADVGELRKLVKAGCPVELIREIVL